MPADPKFERDVERELVAIRKRRDRLNIGLAENHEHLVGALRDGYAGRVDVTKMARLAGISRATAHRLLKTTD